MFYLYLEAHGDRKFLTAATDIRSARFWAAKYSKLVGAPVSIYPNTALTKSPPLSTFQAGRESPARLIP